MFERYTISKSAEDLHAALEVEVPERYAPRFNAAPTSLLPVVTMDQPDGLSFFYWGLPPSMAKNKSIGKKLTNASAEEIFSKPSYRNAIETRRCIIPADGLYFWKKVSKKGKVPYRIFLNNEDTFFLGGIWDEFEQEGAIVHTFNIITQPSIPNLQEFTDVMPLIISREDYRTWMQKSSVMEIERLIVKPFEGAFGSYPVSSRINHIDIDQADLIKQSSPMDQFGNYSLFD